MKFNIYWGILIEKDYHINLRQITNVSKKTKHFVIFIGQLI